jgi:hypothetical protein
MAGFAAAVLRAMTWRAIVLMQLLGLLYALVPWLITLGRPSAQSLRLLLLQDGVTALCVMVAALAGDEAARRGWRVWRAFVTALVGASVTVALVQLGLDAWLGIVDPLPAPRRLLFTFFEVGTVWGTVLMVYLNRRSARRILAGVRAGELVRLQTERHLLSARLAAAEARVDPAAVLHRLGDVRDLYARDDPDADGALEQLIATLRATTARALAASEGAAEP